MEGVRNEAVEVRRNGKAELAVLEPSMFEEEEKDKIKGEKIVRWERFLPQWSLRVLVVEANNSTRQLVSALLRNCSYQVTAVGDGLLAWELLEDPSNHFDIVLTEVAMPSLSGIGLLCKITSHETLKNIPVIMMSSLDSMSMVFKCLSKGAVDFLVKPVRKNELQNLWQHVWRRCHISNGSSSGSWIQNAAHSKSEAGSGNLTDSIGGIESASSGLDIREGSDDGSGTQGSWTNQYAEVESSHQRGKWKRRCSYGNMFAQVTQPKKDKTQNDWMQVVETSGKQDAKACDDTMHHDLEPGQVPTYVECLREESTLRDQAFQKKETDHSSSCAEGNQIGSDAGSEPLIKSIDFIGTMASKPQYRHGDQEDGGSGKGKLDTGVNCSHGKDKTLSDNNSMLELELTLNRLQANCNENSKIEDKCTLRESDASAFSRYNMGGTHFSFPLGGSFPENVHPLPIEYKDQYCSSSENTGSLHLTVPFDQVSFSKGSGGNAPDQYQLSESTDNQDGGSYVIGPSGQDTFPSPVLMKDETGLISPVPLQVGVPVPMPLISFDNVPPTYSPALHPMFYSYPGVPLWSSDVPLRAERGDACDNSAHHEPHIVSLQNLDHSNHSNHLHHHHIQHHHHHHHHHHKGHQHKQHAKQVECAVDNAATTAPWGSSSNMPGNTVDDNYRASGSSNGHGSNGNTSGSASGSNYNGSASGSNYNGSNVHNGQSSAAVTTGTNGGSESGNIVSSAIGSGVGKNRSARQEEASTKFRQKRKEML